MKNFRNARPKPAKTTKSSCSNPNQSSQSKANHRPSQSADDDIVDFSQVNYLKVTANQDGQRIDNFLLARLKGLPRSHLYKLIRSDEVRINGKRCKAFDRVYVGDVVRVAPIRLSAKADPVVSDEFAKGLLDRVLYEDDGLIVLNKPYGMAVHGGSGESFGVIEALRVAMDKKYLELVHRIDKDTSGLLLIAKKRSTLKDLQDHFREKNIQKDYLCLTWGALRADLSLIDKPLLKYTLASGERRVKVDTQGKPSQTKITLLDSFVLDGQGVSLVQASPLTGRTHQIRVHLSSVGHALLGDDKYQTHSNPSGVKRLCLHAYRLSLPKSAHCPNRPQMFIAPLPPDLSAVIGNQRLKRLGLVDK